MMINECQLSTLDEFSEDHVVKKDVSSGGQFKTLLINIVPGQEMPCRSHAGSDLILIPQQGAGVLFADDASQIDLLPGFIYTDHKGGTFGLRNAGDKPFQVVVILVRSTGN